jgi:hypothetical protein
MKNKAFDAVGFMRRRRSEIDQEDEGLTWEERREKTRKILQDDALLRRLRHRAMPEVGQSSAAEAAGAHSY